MIRQSVLRGVRPFSTSLRVLAEGDVARGGAQGDAFSKREKANEDQFIKQQELQKLAALKEKLGNQKKNIDELMDHIDQMTAKSNSDGK